MKRLLLLPLSLALASCGAVKGRDQSMSSLGGRPFSETNPTGQSGSENKTAEENTHAKSRFVESEKLLGNDQSIDQMKSGEKTVALPPEPQAVAIESKTSLPLSQSETTDLPLSQ